MSAPSTNIPAGNRDHPDDDRDSRKRKQNPNKTVDERKERKCQKKAWKEAEEQQRVAEEESKRTRKAVRKARKREVAVEQAAREEAERVERLDRQRQEFEELQQLATETAARMQEPRKELGESDMEDDGEGEDEGEDEMPARGREVVAVLDSSNECDFCRKHWFACELVAGGRACRMCKLKKTKCLLLPVSWVNRWVKARTRKSSGKPESKDDDNNNNEKDDTNAGRSPTPRWVTRSATQHDWSGRSGPCTRVDELREDYGRLAVKLRRVERQQPVAPSWEKEYDPEGWVEYADDDEEGPAPTGVIIDDGWVPEDDLEPEDMAMTPLQPVVQVDPAEGEVSPKREKTPEVEAIVKAELVEVTVGGTMTGRYRVIVEEGGREVLDIQDLDDEMDVDPVEPVGMGVPEGEVEGQNGQ
ncbi:hypothetical protein C8J57DRAFT_1541128 [Mycena rebaudengoi]|nr:hypothetical protein C8J57DRAFT_1541128 [Mycena rebaudengoi]